MTPLDRFKALSEEARPMQSRMAEIAYEQMQLSQQISIGMLREAYPNATFRAVNPIGEIKPTDMSKSTADTITALKAAGIEPTEILIDDRRKIITLIR